MRMVYGVWTRWKIWVVNFSVVVVYRPEFRGRRGQVVRETAGFSGDGAQGSSCHHVAAPTEIRVCKLTP